MQLFEPMCESSHCRAEEWSFFGGWFSWFLGRQLANKWLCTTQNWLFCVVLVVRLRHVQFFRKNRQAIICLEVLGARATFVGFGSSWNIQSITVYFWAHTRKSTIHQLSRCYRCVSKHRDRIFGAFSSSDWQIVWDPTRKNFLIVHAILNVCCSL